jgi:hypothetical protein
VAGDADDAVGPEEPPRLGIGRVLLAHMDAVAAGRRGEVGPVIEEKRDATLLGDRTEDIAGAPNRVVVDVLQTQLHRGDVAGVQRFREPVAECRGIERYRRDQIEARALGRQGQAFP